MLGSPGGPRIVSTVFQVLVALADRGLAARDALALPRLHHQAVPDRLRLESRGFSEETATALVKWDAASDARGVGGAAKVRIRARILGSGPGTTAVEAAP